MGIFGKDCCYVPISFEVAARSFSIFEIRKSFCPKLLIDISVPNLQCSFGTCWKQIWQMRQSPPCTQPNALILCLLKMRKAFCNQFLKGIFHFLFLCFAYHLLIKQNCYVDIFFISGLDIGRLWGIRFCNHFNVSSNRKYLKTVSWDFKVNSL